MRNGRPINKYIGLSTNTLYIYTVRLYIEYIYIYIYICYIYTVRLGGRRLNAHTRTFRTGSRKGWVPLALG